MKRNRMSNDTYLQRSGQYLFFGLVNGFGIELGYFSLMVLEEVHGPLELPMERDLLFKPTSLRELKEKHQRDRGE
jgi:hypothetical protein